VQTEVTDCQTLDYPVRMFDAVPMFDVAYATLLKARKNHKTGFLTHRCVC
jgi:hypothetical protein